MRSKIALLSLLVVTAACGGVAGTAGTTGGGAPAPAPSEVAAGLASGGLEDHGCGYGFTVGTLDQTIRLSLFNDAGHGETPEPGSVELGDDWSGRLVAGRDLFAQWCDDVIGPDEPEVVEEASWEVVGTLTWELVEGDGQCPSTAAATLVDGEVVTDDGPVELGPVEFRNEYFGCFAG